MTRFLDTFCKDQSGAVTVDWVILTASVVAMAAISFYTIRDSSSELMEAAGSAVAQEAEKF